MNQLAPIKKTLSSHVIVQNCFVVPDLDTAIQCWLNFGYGPFLTADFEFPEMLYRGEVVPLKLRAAFTQAGDVQVELIQQTSSGTSVYRDMFAPNEGGFHHICNISRDYRADMEMMKSNGFVIAGEGKVGDLEFCYVDTRPALGCMTELVPDVPQLQTLYKAVRDAAVGWDGSQPIRPL